MKHKSFEELTIEQQAIWERELAEYWAKELAKPPHAIVYLPTAQRGAETLIGPLFN